MANCTPVHNLRCLLVSLHVEGEPFRLATEGCHLVQLSHHRFLCGYWPSRRVRSESHVIGKVSHRMEAMTFGHELQITEVTIHSTNEGLLMAYYSPETLNIISTSMKTNRVAQEKSS